MIVKKIGVVCDLDGTLCDARDRVTQLRNIEKPTDEDWKKFYEECVNDKLIVGVDMLLRTLVFNGYHIVFITGRPTNYREETLKWLEQNSKAFKRATSLEKEGTGCLLLMRPTLRKKDDKHLPDIVMKKEMYHNFIEPHYSVHLWIEDRHRVVDMVRNDLGLYCVQSSIESISEGDF